MGSLEVISKLEKLELQLNEPYSSKIKSVLSSVLEEYKPINTLMKIVILKKTKPKQLQLNLFLTFPQIPQASENFSFFHQC